MEEFNPVLLIDDDHIFNSLNQRILQKHKVQPIKTVANGQQGIDYLLMALSGENTEDYPVPSLIFLDINMPVMDGWEFLDEFKSQQTLANCHLPILMLTASKNPDDEKSARLNPLIADYLVKPLSSILVQNIVATYFPGLGLENPPS